MPNDDIRLIKWLVDMNNSYEICHKVTYNIRLNQQITFHTN